MRPTEQKLRPTLIPPTEAARLLREGRLGARIEALARLAEAAAMGHASEPEQRA